jgi:hypothetical protein
VSEWPLWTTVNESIKPPGKNWSTAFHKCQPELKATSLKVLEWDQHKYSIYEKVVEWYIVIEKKLKNPALKPHNVYNMDETGVLLAVLNSLKVLVSSDDLWKCRSTVLQITAAVARQPLQWPDKPSAAIGILTELPNALAKCPQMPPLYPLCKGPCLPLH